LSEKGCDVVVANEVGRPGIGFGADENAVTLVFADGRALELPPARKDLLAQAIWDKIAQEFAAAARKIPNLEKPKTERASARRGSMPSALVEEKIGSYRPKVIERLQYAGDTLASRQEMGGHTRGNVPPWPGSGDGDFHGTLSAIWVWSRGKSCSATTAILSTSPRRWSFVESNWSDFIPRSLGAHASDEAAYDCAMVLRAWMAGDGHKVIDDESARRERVASAARLLGAYVTDLENLSGREFKDPGFWRGRWANTLAPRTTAASAPPRAGSSTARSA
jgi:hypothetical protein